jgi:CRP-like cAMP-binding protein
VTKAKTIDLLKSVPLFDGLSKRELDAVFRTGKEVQFDEGHDIVEEGATGIGFHLILDGQVDVLVRGRRRASLGRGDYFGEMSLLDGGPRSATCRTASEVRTLALTPWAFLSLIERSPSIAKKLLVELSKRLRNLEKSLQA